MHQQLDIVNGVMENEDEAFLQEAIGEEIVAINENFGPVQEPIGLVQLIIAPLPENAMNGDHVHGIEDSSTTSHSYTDSSWSYHAASTVDVGQSSSTSVTEDAADVHDIPPEAEGNEIAVSDISELSKFTVSNEAASEMQEFGGSEAGNNSPQEPIPTGSVTEVHAERGGCNFSIEFLQELGFFLSMLSVGFLMIVTLSFKRYLSDIILIIFTTMSLVLMCLSLLAFIYAYKIQTRPDRNLPGNTTWTLAASQIESLENILSDLDTAVGASN